MNRIEFRVVLQGCCGRRSVVDLCIDGKPFTDLVREAEAAQAAAEQRPGLAGSYEGLPAAEVLPPSRHFLGKPEAQHLSMQDRVHILGCDCGESGCWPLACRMTTEGNQVRWSDFCQPHRSSPQNPAIWNYDGLGPFTFGRAQYEEALELAAAESKALELPIFESQFAGSTRESEGM